VRTVSRTLDMVGLRKQISLPAPVIKRVSASQPVNQQH
jgi:hypothetical protein